MAGDEWMLPYDDLLSNLNGLFEGERDPIANAANTPATTWQHLPDINWAGFYFLKGGELVLGPFHGKLACVRIALGKGVCGTAAAGKKTVVVLDVHKFPGHIACATASNFEIVVPLIRKRRLVSVLEIDSPSRDRFAEADRIDHEAMAAAYVAARDA
jgi:GAF domain-containing protein